jgi:amino acid adenylation domain-containing protein
MIRACFLLDDLLADTARARPASIAVTSGGAALPYHELARRSDALARTLADAGVERGDRVVVFADNGIDAVVAFWATLKANAVIVIVHPQTKPKKLEYLLADSRARAMIANPHLPFAGPAADSPYLRAVLVTGTPAWAAAQALGTPPVRRCIDLDLAAIIYTSGSTGEPKGVMLTHRNMLAAVSSISEYLEIRSDDVLLCVLPLAFDYGLYQMIMAVAAGARLVLERSFAFPADILRLVAAERVTGFPGVPTMFATMLAMKSLEAFDLSSIRYVTNTAAALPVKHVLALRDLFPAAKIFSMYGLTECKRCTYLPPEDLGRKPDSVGLAIPNTELWIVDEHDRQLPPGQVGQLVIRGATVMRGYWDKPDATAKKLRPGPLPGETVLYTGDLCRLDDEGYLYFVARMDDVIKSRGEKVPPKAVEAAILDIPGVREVAVIGIPDEVLGQAIKAFVVVDPEVVLDVAAIQRECRVRLESFMVPTQIVLRDSLPRSGNGKIQKTDLV